MEDNEHRDEQPAPRRTNADMSEQEKRDLGSAVANAWIITPPGGQPMSLSEHHEMVQAQKAEEKKRAAVVEDFYANEDAIREAKRAEDAKKGIHW